MNTQKEPEQLPLPNFPEPKQPEHPIPIQNWDEDWNDDDWDDCLDDNWDYD